MTKFDAAIYIAQTLLRSRKQWNPTSDPAIEWAAKDACALVRGDAALQRRVTNEIRQRAKPGKDE